MARRRRFSQSLGARATQAGVLAAAANIPLTFQRTLMPRPTGDQALVTGLSASTNHALVTIVQESIQAASLLLLGSGGRESVDERRWSRATIALDLVAIGAGLAIQRAFRPRSREPLPRAATRTGGFVLTTSATAGAVVGGLQEIAALDGRRRGPRDTLPFVAPAAGVLAAAGELRRRRAARLDAQLPPEEVSASVGKALGLGLGVAAGASTVGFAERVVADVVARGASRVLPGNEAIWRPLGHVVASWALAEGVRRVAQQVFHHIEGREESVEAAFDIPPPNELLSGAVTSQVAFDTLSRQGRRFAWMVTPGDVLERVMGEPRRADPIRTYVGLDSAGSEEARVELALRELERTGALEREWLMVVSPTGTGYVNYAAVSVLELLTRGDCATVAMQYAARPSVLSLDRVGEGRQHMRLLVPALRERLSALPADRRPKVVLFGESLGAWTSQDPFVDRGTRGLEADGVDFAIWIGTPHFSKWKEQVLYDGRTDVDRSLVGVFNDIDEWHRLDPAARSRIRYVMITHHDDGVARFGPELAVQAPEWLGESASRPSGVPRGMRWVPTTTFFQVLVDMKNSANVVPGVLAARGHDYRADLLPFFHAVLGLDATSEQLDRIASWLAERELQRTQWIANHAAAGKSLAAAVVARWMEEQRAAGLDPDATLFRIIRSIAEEELAAGGGAGSGSTSREPGHAVGGEVERGVGEHRSEDASAHQP